MTDSISNTCFFEYCHINCFPAKTTIINPGDRVDTLYYIQQGSVTVFIEDEQGKQLILAYLNAGDFIGEEEFFTESHSQSVLVRTREPCRLAEISYDQLRSLVQDPVAACCRQILFILGRQLARRLLEADRKISRLVFLDISGRVAQTLLDLCRQPNAMTHPSGIQIRTTRREISCIVGCSQEMVGKTLKQLQQQGLIWARGETIVVYNDAFNASQDSRRPSRS